MTNSLQAALDKIKNDEVLKDTKLSIRKPITALQSNTRKGTVLIGAHVSPKVQKQLKILAAEEEKTQQDLIQEALRLLFIKYGKDGYSF